MQTRQSKFNEIAVALGYSFEGEIKVGGNYVSTTRHDNQIFISGQIPRVGSTVVVTAISPMNETHSAINLFQLAMWNKEVKGTIFGSLNPRADIPKLLGMYRDGQLKLDELITKRYALEEINEGYRAMRDGENIRGVIIYG